MLPLPVAPSSLSCSQRPHRSCGVLRMCPPRCQEGRAGQADGAGERARLASRRDGRMAVGGRPAHSGLPVGRGWHKGSAVLKRRDLEKWTEGWHINDMIFEKTIKE